MGCGNSKESAPAKPACPVTGEKGAGSLCPFADIVKKTAPAVGPKVPEIIADFYPRMFKNDPEAKAFFNPANQFENPARQHLALGNAVVAYATNIDKLENLTGAVQMIAHKHCALMVQAEHYPIVHRNLMEAIGAVLGPEVATPEIAGGWSEAVLALANILIAAEADLYKSAEQRLGGWKGWKDFKVDTIREVTVGCKEFTFKPVDGSGPIDFTPGQFLTVQLQSSDATPRHYTITNAPGKDYLQCCPKKLPGGVVSNALHGLKVGDIVGLAPPFGVFEMTEKPAVLISAGIGATPMKCFMDSAKDRVKLALHVDKSEQTHPFREEFLASGIETHFVYTNTSGRPAPEKLVEEVLKPYIAECDFFLCGPPGFVSSLQTALQGAGAQNVNMDIFGPTLAGVDFLPKGGK